jgi:hypothetical protein
LSLADIAKNDQPTKASTKKIMSWFESVYVTAARSGVASDEITAWEFDYLAAVASTLPNDAMPFVASSCIFDNDQSPKTLSSDILNVGHCSLLQGCGVKWRSNVDAFGRCAYLEGDYGLCESSSVQAMALW